MWQIKAGTTIQVYAPHGKVSGPCTVQSGDVSLVDDVPWKPYTTKEDKLYDNHEVWDIVAVQNERGDVPTWAKHNIVEHSKVIVCRNGAYAMCGRDQIEYLD